MLVCQRQLAALAVVAAIAGCTDRTDGAPAAQLVAYVQSLSGGGVAGVHPLLEPPLQHEIATLHATLRRSAALVRERFPKPMQQDLLDRTAATLAEASETPAEFFGALVAQGGGWNIERLAQWGARPLSESQEGDTTVIETLAGDRFAFRKAEDGSWRIVAPEAFSASVRAANEVAARNLAQLERDLARLEELRAGRPVP